MRQKEPLHNEAAEAVGHKNNFVMFAEHTVSFQPAH
jgi:hypothetical protein